MSPRTLTAAILAFGVLSAGAEPAPAASGPLDVVKNSTERVIAIVKDPTLKAPGKEEERRQKMIAVIDGGFNWEAMARRSLGRHWRTLTDEQRARFVALFTELIRGTYMGRVEAYTSEKVFYRGERIDGDYARVTVDILSVNNNLIPVVYSMKRYDGRWLVYDLAIEGVKIVNNYRRQFDSILGRQSFDGLLKRIETTIANREKRRKKG